MIDETDRYYERRNYERCETTETRDDENYERNETTEPREPRDLRDQENHKTLCVRHQLEPPTVTAEQGTGGTESYLATSVPCASAMKAN